MLIVVTRSQKTNLNPLLQWVASATLFVWLSAVAFCTVHCTVGGGHEHDHGSQASSQDFTASHSHEHDGSPSDPAHHDSPFSAACSTLESALLGSHLSSLIVSQCPVLYVLATSGIQLDATAIEPPAPFSREHWPRDWVFTPEVCLGPAHRSHAPPFLS